MEIAASDLAYSLHGPLSRKSELRPDSLTTKRRENFQ
jgi:hypothetical protein